MSAATETGPRGLLANLRRPRPRRSPAQSGESGRPLRYVHRHLSVSSTGTWAWYRLPGDVIGGAHDELVDISRVDHARVWAALAGTRVHLIGVTEEMPAAAYAEGLRATYPHPAADQPGAQSWDELVESAQGYAVASMARRTSVVVGVRITTQQLDREHLPMALAAVPAADRLGKVEAARRRIADVTETLAGYRPTDRMSDPTAGARPLDEDALVWLDDATRAMGCPTREVGEVKVTADPYALASRVDAIVDGHAVTRHVAVLRHVDALDRDATTGVPWLGWSASVTLAGDDAPAPDGSSYRDRAVEWTACFDVLDGVALAPSAALRLRINKSITEHNREHGHGDEELGDADAFAAAQRVKREISDARPEVACRLVGQVLYAVSGATAHEAEDRARELVKRARREARMTLEHGYAQAADLECFAPGASWDLVGHITTVPVAFAAQGRPSLTGPRPDLTGWPLGQPDQWPTPYLFNAWGGSRANRPNLTVIGGEPGCGKTTLALLLCYLGTRSGIRGSLFDPSGLTASMQQVPSIRGEYRELPITRGRAGVLMPSLLVPVPQRGDYDSDAEHADAVVVADTERVLLEVEALRLMLSYETQSQAPRLGLTQRLTEAVRTASGFWGGNPWDTLDALDAAGGVSRDLGRELRAAADMHARLIFPPRTGAGIDPDAEARELASAGMTVVTAPGLQTPPKGVKDRGQWTHAQRMSEPILMLGLRHAERTIWADRAAKYFFGDELGITTGGASAFTPFLMRLMYDSRKFNAASILAFQTFSTLARLDPNVSTLIGAKFVGRTAADDAADVLPLMGLPAGRGWEQKIAAQRPGTFTVSDWSGQVATVAVDQSWWEPAMRSATYTTPQTPGMAGAIRGPMGEW